jgi:hypothetical protein
MRRALSALEKALDSASAGSVSPWPYALLRVGLALILLVRSSDLTRPVLDLEHHLWVHGLDFSWSAERAPYLVSPAVTGFALAPISNDVLVLVRTLLAVSLLVGLRPRFSAAALAIVSYSLLLADRYRYFHHLHLLYLATGLLAFCPIGARLDLERGARRLWRRIRRAPVLDPASSESCAAWPLLLFRALISGVYLSAGLAKLDPAYWSGQTLAELDRLGMLGGPGWAILHSAFGYVGLARLSCLIELSLPFLLAFRRVRWLGVGPAVGFHLLIGSALAVSSFGATMVVLLLSYWPKSRSCESSPEIAGPAYNGRAG